MVVEENGKSARRTKRFPMQISDTLGGKLASKVTDETVSSIEARLHDHKPGSTKVAGKDFQFLKLEVFTVYWDLSTLRFISCIPFLFPTHRTSGFANVLRRLLNEKVQKCWRITGSTRSRSKLLYHPFDEKFDHEISLYFHHLYFSFNSVLCYSHLFRICKRICFFIRISKWVNYTRCLPTNEPFFINFFLSMYLLHVQFLWNFSIILSILSKFS